MLTHIQTILAGMVPHEFQDRDEGTGKPEAAPAPVVPEASASGIRLRITRTECRTWDDPVGVAARTRVPQK